MTSTYILDTSAIISIARGELIEIGKSAAVYISPLSFWELACHLDEPVEDETPERSFLRQRGQVLKCDILKLLDDPYAFHAVIIGAPQVVNKTRFEDRAMVPQVLMHLNASTVLTDFYSKAVTYPTGETASIRDLAANARQALDTEEDYYEKSVRSIAAIIEKEIDLPTLKSLNEHQFVNLALLAVPVLADDYRTQGVADPDLFGRVVASLYPCLGYKISRIRRAMLNAGSAKAMSVNVNDTEDSAICLYLDLLHDNVLVTGDDGTKSSLTEAFNAIDRSMRDLAGPAAPTRQCRVLNVEGFKTEVRIDRATSRESVK